MAALPFAFQKRDDPERYRRFLKSNVDPGFIANGVTDEALRQGRADIEARGAQLTYPADIDPNYVPPAAAEEPSPAIVAPQAPAVDPKLLAAATERVAADPSTPPPTRLSAMPEPPPEMEWNPIITDKSGRPKVSPTAKGDPGRILDKQREAVDRYEPKSEPKWKRWLRIGVGAASLLGGSVARDPRAVAMAAEGLGRNIGSGKWPDEYWKREQQTEIGKRQDENLERRKAAATITNLEAQPGLKKRQEDRLQKGVDLRGQRVSDQKINEGLSRYNQLKNYDPSDPKHAGLKKIFEENYGLYDLPVKSDDKFAIKMVNGEYEWIPTKPGEVVPVTKDGKPLVDRSKVPDQSVTLPNGTVLDNLTPREKAMLEGRTYEGEENRESREKIAAGVQAGQNARAVGANKGGGGSAVSASVKGAASAMSRYRGMTANIEKQKIYYGNADGPAPDDHPAIRALYEQRDGYEADMRKMYGQHIQFNEYGKPEGLRDDATQAPSRNGLSISEAIKRFEVKNKRKPTEEETQRMQTAIDSRP